MYRYLFVLGWESQLLKSKNKLVNLHLYLHALLHVALIAKTKKKTV